MRKLNKRARRGENRLTKGRRRNEKRKDRRKEMKKKMDREALAEKNKTGKGRKGK